MQRQVRQWALMVLYGLDVHPSTPEQALQRFFSAFGDGRPLDPQPSWAREADFCVDVGAAVGGRAWVEDRVSGVARGKEAIDAELRRVSTHWRLERMALVDRNILRLAAFELMFRSEEVPRKVAINEAVELAKRFGGEESRAFVNGVLERVGQGR